MDLINQSGLAAEIVVSDQGDSPRGRRRSVVVVAKATYEADGGRLRLVEGAAVPIQWDEAETPLGLLPRDVTPPREPGLEVCLLGAAYAPGGTPTTSMEVHLDVADHRRSLTVVGDRISLRSDDGEWTTGEPSPFTRLPLVWERAFGGTIELELDASTKIPVSHRWNPLGQGFDPGGAHVDLETAVGAAEGYPNLPATARLPNLLRAGTELLAPCADAEPYCWAPVPIELGVRSKWELERQGVRVDEEPEPPPSLGSDRGLWFSHPELRVDVPSPGEWIRLQGCRPEGDWTFPWPNLQVEFDYVVGAKRGTRSLPPQLMVLMPEERRFTITYRAWFRFLRGAEDEERTARLSAY